MLYPVVQLGPVDWTIVEDKTGISTFWWLVITVFVFSLFILSALFEIWIVKILFDEYQLDLAGVEDRRSAH